MLESANPLDVHILIVEDDAPAGEALRRFLGLFGYQAITAESVEAALTHLDGQTHVITDLRLGDGVGTTVLAQLLKEHHPARVALATGEADDSSLLRDALCYKPEAHFVKPVDLSRLLEWLRGPPVA
jgi:DNA-binding NtrC family response regulator